MHMLVDYDIWTVLETCQKNMSDLRDCLAACSIHVIEPVNREDLQPNNKYIILRQHNYNGNQ